MKSDLINTIILRQMNSPNFVLTPANCKSKRDCPANLTLKEYNKAVRRLRMYMRSGTVPDKKVILACCALFYCSDNTRGERDWALTHLNTALSLLKQPSGVEGAADSKLNEINAADEIDILKQFFVQLDLQAAMFDHTRLPTFTLASPDEKCGRVNCVPFSFTKFSQAEIAFNKLENWIMQFVISNAQHKFKTEPELPPTVAREMRELKKQFERWETALTRC